MSRSSFERGNLDWATTSVELGLEKAGVEDIEAKDLFIERDSLLENDLLETSIEDYDDLLSMAQDDGFGFQE